MIDLLHALATAIDARDGGDPAHIARVRRRAAALGTALGLSDSELRSLDLAAILHDAGKLAVPAHVLLKPEALTPEEFALIRRHPEAGAAIVASTDPDAAAIVRSHHERTARVIPMASPAARSRAARASSRWRTTSTR
jgi:HD-GYP domain-containing protein (c-di-GMP phosphodiesterase class II)